MAAVKANSISGRRTLRYENVDDALADVDAILAADADGRLQAIGNWTPGQTMAHVAAWIEYGYDGFPMKPPIWPIRWLLQRMLPKTLRDGMKPGVRIPGIKGGTTGADDIPIEAAAERLKTALLRLKAGEVAKFDSPAFGPMDHQRRTQLNLRHAELHLSFLCNV